MTIEEAIKELSFWETRFHDYNDPRMTKAIKLGIEALKRLKQNRLIPSVLSLNLLPGETEEVKDVSDK